MGAVARTTAEGQAAVPVGIRDALNPSQGDLIENARARPGF